jgi:hypothetical protein
MELLQWALEKGAPLRDSAIYRVQDGDALNECWTKGPPRVRR